MSVERIALFYLAHSRTGDKGNSQTMSLIPYQEEDYALLAEQVTEVAVKRHFGTLVEGPVTRYELPNVRAFNFVLEDALQGGVNDSLALDTHGKSRSSVFLTMEVQVPAGHGSLRTRERMADAAQSQRGC